MENNFDQLSTTTDYFGFDLGDGESAVAWLKSTSRTEPQLIELRGRKSVITALASHSERGMFIGEEACHLTGADWLEVRFKSRYLKDKTGAGSLLTMFTKEILSALKADGRLDNIEDASFFIGCPSGWSKETRADYALLFKKAGIPDCTVISESRAAFLFARESGELQVGDDLVTLPTLIIDAGSSTTDFTFVADLAERALTVSDFGDVSLGGGIIDALLLERNVRRSADRQQLEEIFAQYPQYAARCEFEARRVKEMYFTRRRQSGESATGESAVKLYIGRTPVTFDITCSEADMQAVLTESCDRLGGLSFTEAYRSALAKAKEALGSDVPQLILLTGGASRMPVIGDEAQRIFPDAKILRGLEPEFAIARGLCYALRIDRKTKGFKAAINALIRSDDMEDLVLLRLPALFEAISKPIGDRLINDVAPVIFEQWRSGGLKTFNDIGTELTTRITEMFKNGEMSDIIRPAVAQWVLKLRPDIEQLTDPICDKFDLPRTSLRLPDTLSIGSAALSVETDQLIRTDSVKAIIDIIVAALIATLMGGSGIALLSTGLPGIVAGFLIGLIGGIIGTQSAEKLLKKSELPIPMRKLITTKFFIRQLRNRQDEITDALLVQLLGELNPPTDSITEMVNTIAASIENQLDMMTEHASLLLH